MVVLKQDGSCITVAMWQCRYQCVILELVACLGEIVESARATLHFRTQRQGKGGNAGNERDGNDERSHYTTPLLY